MCYLSVGGQIADSDTGGGKIITFSQIHNAIITLSSPEGGQTPLPTSMGGHSRICPLDPPLVSVNYNMKINTKNTKVLRVSKGLESNNEDSSCRGNYRTSQGILLLRKHDLR